MRNLCFLLTLVATLLLPGRLIAAALPQDEKLITETDGTKGFFRGIMSASA